MSEGRHAWSASVVMPTYNKSRYLDLTLASYVNQVARRYELVVVDDGSTDDTAAVVQRYANRLPLTLVRQPNAGRSAARNAGLRAATGDIVIFSDDDRIVPPSFVADHVGAFARADEPLLVQGWQRGMLTWWSPEVDDDERVRDLLGRMARPPVPAGDAVAARTGAPLLSARDLLDSFDAVVGALAVPEPWWEAHCRRVLDAFPDPGEFRLGWMIGTTGNMSVSRAHLDAVGWFDERFTRWGLEDTELCYRVVRHGARMVVSEAAVSYHQIHPGPASRLTEWTVNYARFTRKHPGVDVLLYLLVSRGQMTPQQAHQISLECDVLLTEGRPLLVEELTRRYHDLIKRPVRAGTPRAAMTAS